VQLPRSRLQGYKSGSQGECRAESHQPGCKGGKSGAQAARRGSEAGKRCRQAGGQANAQEGGRDPARGCAAGKAKTVAVNGKLVVKKSKKELR